MGLKLRAELGGDGSGFHAMMNRANAAKDKFASAFGGLKNVIAGAFTVGAITSFANKTIQAASHLRDLADRLGVNVEWLQETGFAAKQAGADVDKLTKFLEKLGENREMALQGGETGRMKLAAFERLGISEAGLRGTNLQGLFDQIAKAYKEGNQQALGPALKEVGGKSAYELAAAFQQGIEENRQLARDAGTVMGEETIDALKAVADQLTTLQEQLMAEFAPAIVSTIKTVTDAVRQLKQFGSGVGRGFTEAEIGLAEDHREGAGLGTKWQRFWKRLSQGFVSGVVSEAFSQDEALAALEAVQKKIREARAARENAAPDVRPLIERGNAEKKTRGPGLVTDSLVGVGNFLGRNPQLVNTLANQHLQVSRDHLAVARETFMLLKASPLMSQMTGLSGLQVPPF